MFPPQVHAGRSPLKNIVKESFPEQYFEIIKFKQEQARINFDYFFPELKIPDNAINFWKQIIQEENLEQFLSVEWKEKMRLLCNLCIFVLQGTSLD
ncbi:hypothetical protein [Spiroplasma endosymbiont of Zeiraphera isertana]|uniref:hypothetical protein n=1 Tax=Spiroplasma endosymbiont of Zeiraphera isertana TaxID=3066313 RepID=UPI00313BF95F